MSGPKTNDKSINDQIIFFYIVSVLITTISRHFTESPNEQQRQEKLPFNRKNLEQDQTHGGNLLLMVSWEERKGEDR